MDRGIRRRNVIQPQPERGTIYCKGVPMPFDRRGFFRSLSLAGLGLPLLRPQAQAQSPKSKRPPKNIIVLISDGMSAGVIALAEIASQRESKRSTNWATLLRDPGTRLR
jgi:hypothetical protein